MSCNNADLPLVHASGPAFEPFEDMAWIAGGTFLMGSNHHYFEEAPVHPVAVDGFWMDCCTVTNAQFAHFVEATGYVTLAERPLDPAGYPGAPTELLVPGSLVFARPAGIVTLDEWDTWWSYIPGADWRHPEGPPSDLGGREHHPVVQVAWEDAQAYACWAGKALPSEAQWEYAARGGLSGATYAWGDEFAPQGRQMANTWQGEFPGQNLQLDGYEGTAPVRAFPANGYGLYEMTGNVWEWTSDWYSPRHTAQEAGSCCVPKNPRGAAPEESFDPETPLIRIPRRVIKGGSFLCAPNYCRRYRPAARSAQAIDTAICHLGFRCMAPEKARRP